jgi:hypothetical protein
MDKIRDKLDSSNIKKIIKAGTLLIGLVLIIFISFFNATFDFENINWFEWLANSSILVGIMIFGILMGGSTGTDIQQEKVVYDDNNKLIGGRFQVACSEYKEILMQIECIKVYFSQFWLWYKERKLIEKKIDYLIDNQFDGRVARIIVKNIEKEDLESGKLLYNIAEPTQKIYVKSGVKIKKLNVDQIEIVRKIFSFKLDTYGESYYLSLFDDTESKVNDVEKGKKINEKINRDKRRNFGLKITSSLIISIVWGALTIYELTGEGDSAVKKAWMNLLSRVCALITSFFSGYSTSVINVRDKASAIENKVDILKTFKSSYDNKLFVPETYEEMIEREFKEQELAENKEVVEEDTEL